MRTINTNFLPSSAVVLLLLSGGFLALAASVTPQLDDSNPLRMPAVGDHQLRLISSNVLELMLVTTNSGGASSGPWNFVATSGNLTLPPVLQFSVTANGQSRTVQSVGFRRRVLYAPMKQYDLRVANYLYLKLSSPINDGSAVVVQNPAGTLWPTNMSFSLTADPLRYSPAIHVNQVGYLPAFPKKAIVGYYLGTLGELALSNNLPFQIRSTETNKIVYTGHLARRPELGFVYTPTPYQQVFEADFSPVQLSGQYVLVVPELGASYPFRIDEGTAAAFARTYELGIYHQRCGTDNSLPYTRFVHPPCHVNPAQIPTMDSPEFDFVNGLLDRLTAPAAENPRHTAPRMTNVMASLYPPVYSGTIDVSGGHHDAGDYSKYTVSVALLIHALMFPVDALPGVKDLDNLGIPESGDGISDLMQEAKWEADSLCKLQDADGGFFFTVMPKNREYEVDVLPENGDPQIVLPKNTSGTAAAVAALAEMASSPTFKSTYPEAAAEYLSRALSGWSFLQQAIATYGRDGSYQMISVFGDMFMHDDELAWAAAALFAATGDPVYDLDLRENTPDPSDPSVKVWGWLSLYGGYGCAFRDYAFAARTGRLLPEQLDPWYLGRCENEIKNAGTNALTWSAHHSYGSSFPDENKPILTAGWYFSGEKNFDVAVASVLDPQPAYLDVILRNFNYEMGCNPLNMTFVTGLGSKRQREIVDQYAQNDRRVLPPSGIPLGNIQQSFSWLWPYYGDLAAQSFPSDGTSQAPYPLYDRWGDTFNLTTEFDTSQQSARTTAAACWLMAQTQLASQPWRSSTGQITGLPDVVPFGQPITAVLDAGDSDLDPAKALIVWEGQNQEPSRTNALTFTTATAGWNWLELEAQWPDGRRVFVATNVLVAPGSDRAAAQTDAATVGFYPLNGDFSDVTSSQADLTPYGTAALDSTGLRVQSVGNDAAGYLANSDIYQPGVTRAVTVEARLFINSYNPLGFGQANILSLTKSSDVALSLTQNPSQTQPEVFGGVDFSVGGADLASALTPGQWHRVNLAINTSGYVVAVDGQQIVHQDSTDLANWAGSDPVFVQAGNFDGWIQDLTVKSIRDVPPPHMDGMTRLSDGSFRCTFSGIAGISYTVLASTNFVDWVDVGFATQVGPGTFQFTDPTSNDFPCRFFQLRVR